MISFPDAYIHS